ncbi:hypothetical protein [Halobacteriovorax sp. HLS]|uniref:hypothetical protein n=1 Tax=Halobacteriovorax sp. HLS TaxID=2234000 RepID=UPI000FDC75AE|nr:hypothetical protein [Halobacteriovorax sp. HLS]
MKKLYLIALIAYYSMSSFAAETVIKEDKFLAIKDFYAGAGSLTQFLGKAQTDESGSTDKFDFNPYISIGTEFHLYESFSITPEIAFGFPCSGRDERISKWSYWLQALGAYSYKDFKFKFGPGLMMNQISSDGGTQTLNNGTGSSDFPMPNGSSTSRNLTLNTAAQWEFTKDVSTRVEAWIVNVTDSESRSLSYTLSFYYHFGSTLW